MQLDQREILARDGTRLSVRIASPADRPVQRSLLWIHGLSEHGGRYEHVLRHWTQRGWRVVLPDHRGHGLSGGIRSDVADFAHYLQDLHEVWNATGLQDGRSALFGHSMGGLLAIRAVQTATLRPAAVVLSSPLLKVRLPVPAWKRTVGRLLTYCAPLTRFRTNINPRNMTRDPAFLERRLADPLIQRSVTARWFFAMEAARQAAVANAASFNVPVLALQGALDETVDPDAIEPWLAASSSPDRSFERLSDNVHEFLNDAGWQEPADSIADWLEARVPSSLP